MPVFPKASALFLALTLLPIFVHAEETAIGVEKSTAKDDEIVFKENTKPVQDSTRVIYSPTATGREKGEWGLTVYDLVLADIEYGLFEHLELGLYIAAPIAIVGLNPHAKIWGRLTSKISAALNLSGTFVFPYLEDERGKKWWTVGSGPLITVGSKDYYLNFGANIFLTNLPLDYKPRAAPLGQESAVLTSAWDAQANVTPWWFVVPTLGASLRVSRKISVLLQAETPFSRWKRFGDMTLVSYGLRFHGKHVALDAAFVLPIYDDMWGLMKYCPIGFPLVTISKGWPKE